MRITITHQIVFKKAKWADNHPHAEIKVENRGTQCLILVAKNGWNYRDQEQDCRNPTPRSWRPPGGTLTSAGMQVRISMNGPLMLKLSEWQEINRYIEEVYKEVLHEHEIRGL